MQTKPFNRFIFATGAAFVATLLALSATTARAGLFDIPSEPADWNGPFVAFNSGVVINNLHSGDYTDVVDLTKQFNTGSGLPADGPPDFFDFFNFGGHSGSETAYTGGIDLGYNKQWGHFVAGLSFGFSGTHTSTSSQGFGFDEGFDSIDDTDFETEVHSIRKVEQNWSGYAGGQIGYAWNRWLFYAMGGAAFAQVDLKTYDVASTLFFPGDGGTAPSRVAPQQTEFFVQSKSVNAINNVLDGWYAGGGVKFALSNVWTVGLEYRHDDYGDRLYHPEAHSAGQVFPGATRVSLDNNVILFNVGILLGHLGEKPAPEPGLSKK